MKKLQVLGTGCAKCQQLTLHTEKAAESLGIEYELEKVTEIAQIMSFGVMATPALVVTNTLPATSTCFRSTWCGRASWPSIWWT